MTSLGLVAVIVSGSPLLEGVEGRELRAGIALVYLDLIGAGTV